MPPQPKFHQQFRRRYLTGFKRDPLAFDVVAGVVIVCSIAGVYSQVLGHQFVAWDDSSYVTENPLVVEGLRWQSVVKVFATFQLANWHPLTLLSHMLDVSIWGLDPGAHAAVNTAIHAANSILVYFCFVHLNSKVRTECIKSRLYAISIALLFAMHPLHVESVAWISERKDVLCAFFWLLALRSYLWYSQQPSVARYLLVTFFLGMSLLSKAMAVTFPLVILILDWYPLARFSDGNKRVVVLRILEKMPWIFIAFMIALLTVRAQSNAMPNLALLDRAQIAVSALGWYLAKTVWPTGLQFYYLTEDAWTKTGVIGSLFVFLTISIVAMRNREKQPVFLIGWLWFLMVLMPVLGLVKVGSQAWADRYAYLPHLGLFWMVFGSLHAISLNTVWSRVVTITTTVGIVLAAITAGIQVRVWQNTESLYKNALQNNKNHYVALMGLANNEYRNGNFDLASNYATRALNLSGGQDLVRSMRILLGDIALKKNNRELAISEYKLGVLADSNNYDANIKLARALLSISNFTEAERQYLLMVKNFGETADVLNGLGVVYGVAGRNDESFTILKRAFELYPNNQAVINNLAIAARKIGKQ